MSDPNENRPGYKPTKVGWIPEGSSGIAEAPLDKYGPFCFNNASTPARPLLACPNVAGFSFPGAAR